MFPTKDQHFIEQECKAAYPWQEARISELIQEGWRVVAMQYLPPNHRGTGEDFYRIAMTRNPNERIQQEGE